MPRRPFVRDVLYFIFTILFLLYILNDGKITLAESIFLVLGYFVYVLIVVVGHVLHTRWRRQGGLLSSVSGVFLILLSCARPVELDNSDELVIQDDDSNGIDEDGLLRPLLGGMPNAVLISSVTYRSPLSANPACLTEHLEEERQLLTPLRTTTSLLDLTDTTINSPADFASQKFYHRAYGVFQQLFPLIGKWKMSSFAERLQHLALLPLVFLFGELI